MVERVPSNLRNMGGAPPVRVRRGGGEGYPEFPYHDRGAGQGTQPGGPDHAEVQKLARELAAEFGREHIVENFRVKSTGPVLIAVDAAPGSAPADGPERKRGPRVLEAVESAPGRISRQPFSISNSISGDYRPAPGNPASGGAPRGDILNFHA